MNAYENAPKYRLWLHNLRRNGMTISGTTPLYTKYKKDGDLLFGLFDLHATTPEGHPMLPLCLVKGPVVSTLICLIDEATGERFLLLVRQRRICDGSLMYEHPAGMVDGDDSPLTVAVREIREETGLEVPENEVVALNTRPLYPSSGTSDEAMYFFFVEKTLPRGTIESLSDAHHDDAGENEHILTRVVPLAEAKALMGNACGLLNIYLYEAARPPR